MAAGREYIRDGKLGEVFYVKVCNMLPGVYGGYPQTKVAASDRPPDSIGTAGSGPAA